MQIYTVPLNCKHKPPWPSNLPVPSGSNHKNQGFRWVYMFFSGGHWWARARQRKSIKMASIAQAPWKQLTRYEPNLKKLLKWKIQDKQRCVLHRKTVVCLSLLSTQCSEHGSLPTTIFLITTVLQDPGTQAPLANRVRQSKGIPWAAAANTRASDIKAPATWKELPYRRHWWCGTWQKESVKMHPPSKVPGKDYSQSLDAYLIRSLCPRLGPWWIGLLYRKTKLLGLLPLAGPWG